MRACLALQQRQRVQQRHGVLPLDQVAGSQLGRDSLYSMESTQNHPDRNGAGGIVAAHGCIGLSCSCKVVFVLDDEIDGSRERALGWGGLANLWTHERTNVGRAGANK